MRIAVNCRFLLPNKLEGLGWYTLEVVRRMVERHPEDQFIFLFDRAYSEEFVFAENIEPLVLFPQSRHPILWYWWFEWSVPRALKKAKADVFFSPDAYCSLRTDVKTLMVTHDIAHVHYPKQIPNIVRRYYDYYVPRFLNRADKVATISNFCKEDILQYYKIPESKILVAHNGSRTNFTPIPSKEQERIKQEYAAGEDYFFYLGAVHPRKNLVRLIQAFNHFKQQSGAPMKLLIGGRMAWQTGEIQQAYEASTYQEDISFLGYVSEELLPKLLASSFALVYVSLFEGFGLPLLEAMYCETPVISSNVTSMPEVAGDAAILVDPESVEDIANGMQTLWANPVMRKTLIEKGKQQRTLFNWDSTAEQIYQELQKLVKLND